MTKMNEELNEALRIACRVMGNAHKAFTLSRRPTFRIERAEGADRIKIKKCTLKDNCEALTVDVCDENEMTPYRAVAFVVNAKGYRCLFVYDNVECINEVIADTVALEWFDEYMREFPEGFEVTLQY